MNKIKCSYYLRAVSIPLTLRVCAASIRGQRLLEGGL